MFIFAHSELAFSKLTIFVKQPAGNRIPNSKTLLTIYTQRIWLEVTQISFKTGPFIFILSLFNQQCHHRFHVNMEWLSSIADSYFLF